MSPLCSKCGAQQQDEQARFCSMCGAPLATAVSPASQQQQSQGASQEQEREATVMEGESKGLTSVATSGRYTEQRYRLTNRMLYVEDGTFTTDSTQVPLWAVHDVDMRQSMIQKSQGTGDVIVHVEHPDYNGEPYVKLKSVEQPSEIQREINHHRRTERIEHDKRQKTHYYGQGL